MLRIEWSSQDYTLRDLEDSFGHLLPVLVNVSQGYCGYGEDFCTFGFDEKYLISRLARQTRIIARDEQGVQYSIPVSYPIKFQVLDKHHHKDAGKAALFLDEILSRCDTDSHHPLQIAPEHNADIRFWQGADKRSALRLHKLEVLSTHEDKYFVANPVIDGTTNDRVIIPLFVNIRVRVAEGKSESLNKLMDILTKQANSTADRTVGNREIMIFDGAEPTSGIYDYLEPAAYVSCNQVSSLRGHVDTYEKANALKASRGEYTTLTHGAKTSTGDIYSEVPTVNRPLPTAPPVLQERALRGITAEIQARNRASALQAGKRYTEEPQSPRHIKQSPQAPTYLELQSTTVTAQSAPHSPRPLPKPPVPEKPVKIEQQSPEPASNVLQQRLTSEPASLGASNDSEPETIYVTVDEVPTSIQRLTKVEIADCLRLLSLEKHADKFLENDVDGALLLELDSDLLTSDLGFTKFEALKLIKFAKTGWRPK